MKDREGKRGTGKLLGKLARGEDFGRMDRKLFYSHFILISDMSQGRYPYKMAKMPQRLRSGYLKSKKHEARALNESVRAISPFRRNLKLRTGNSPSAPSSKVKTRICPRTDGSLFYSSSLQHRWLVLCFLLILKASCIHLAFPMAFILKTDMPDIVKTLKCDFSIKLGAFKILRSFDRWSQINVHWNPVYTWQKARIVFTEARIASLRFHLCAAPSTPSHTFQPPQQSLWREPR